MRTCGQENKDDQRDRVGVENEKGASIGTPGTRLGGR